MYKGRKRTCKAIELLIIFFVCQRSRCRRRRSFVRSLYDDDGDDDVVVDDDDGDVVAAIMIPPMVPLLIHDNRGLSQRFARKRLFPIK